MEGTAVTNAFNPELKETTKGSELQEEGSALPYWDERMEEDRKRRRDEWRAETRRMQEFTKSQKPGDPFDEEEYQAWVDSHVGEAGPISNDATTSAPADGTFTSYVKPEMTTYESGGIRADKTGRGRFSCIPPNALRSLARRFEDGGKIHGDDNWQKGLPLSLYVDAMYRHLLSLVEGEMDEDHVGALMWNAAAYQWTRDAIRQGDLPGSLNDISYDSKAA